MSTEVDLSDFQLVPLKHLPAWWSLLLLCGFITENQLGMEPMSLWVSSSVPYIGSQEARARWLVAISSTVYNFGPFKLWFWIQLLKVPDKERVLWAATKRSVNLYEMTMHRLIKVKPMRSWITLTELEHIYELVRPAQYKSPGRRGVHGCVGNCCHKR